MCLFETDRLILRPLEKGDAVAIDNLLADIELARTTLNIPYPYPDGLAEQWINRVTEKMKKGSHYSFAIILKGTMQFIGSITLDIALNHKRAEMTYWIGKPFWDNGYVTEAASRIISLAFEDLHVNRVWAAVMRKNKPSVEVMKKLNLFYEGTFHQHVLKWGVYEDVSYYGIVKEQYEKFYKRT